MVDSYTVELTVNGELVRREVSARLTLADFLRDELKLTGTHLGCEHGVCGACSILLDGDAVRACLMFAVQAHGRSITTIEGLTPESGMSPLQQSFCEHHALQCGYCTPGMIIAAEDFLGKTRSINAAAVRSALSGNICRCTGYEPIVAAVLAEGQRRGIAETDGE